MKNLIKTLLIAVIFIFSAVNCNAATTSYDRAMKSSKPFALYIYMSGCPACRKFDTVFSKISSKYANKYNFVRAEYRSGLMPQICEKWGVRGFPFMAFVNPKTNSGKRIPYECMWDDACLKNAFYSFP